MILLTVDASGQTKFFSGFYRDNTICWSTHEHVAIEKTLGELTTIAVRNELPYYMIRERIRVEPTLWQTVMQLI